MKPVHLSFEEAQASPARWLAGSHGGWLGWSGVAVLAVALAWTGASAWQWARARQELSAAQSELQVVLGRPAHAAAAAAKPVLTPQQRRAWNQVLGQLNTPWASLLNALEAATPEDVALVSIEPDAKQGSVRLQAEAKTLDTLLAYAQVLKGAEPFSEVAPLKHETNEQDPNRPMRLTLDIRLREAKGSEPSAAGDVR